MIVRLALWSSVGMLVAATSSAYAQEAVIVPSAPAPTLSAELINAADLTSIPAQRSPDVEQLTPSPAIVRLQILLDRAAASPGVIDGFDGDNVRKAIMALDALNGLPEDGTLDAEVLARLGAEPVVGAYTISEDDVKDVTGPTPDDYADKALKDYLGYETVAEAVAERFHMDVDLLAALNPEATYTVGEQIVVAAPGQAVNGAEVARIVADKDLRQVRAYDEQGTLIVAYPATIGSEDNPSPSGSHVVEGVATMPNYTYNPKINFQQGENAEVLTIPPGPNGPVGSMWIDLSEPTYGIHGTPEPSLIDKTGSHGCVRLTNWDAEELAGMVSPGVVVDFIGG
jgi:lipoprotein-anchoring transpeptidase ErfK/SrfK